MPELLPTTEPELKMRLRHAAATLAAEGIFIGTSSWKYSGWTGLFYDEPRYHYRGKFAEARFERACLAEYAEVFKTVCVDAAYYQFPSEKYLAGLGAQVPDDFQFTFKVTDDITLKRFPNLPRFGMRAGQPNQHFLDADLFQRAFLAPCETVRPRVGLLIFEFSRFYPTDYEHGRDFTTDLDAFLGKLPAGWRYVVELRNRHWLQPEYFAMLHRHGVAHVFNSWDAMPPVSEQMAMAGSETSEAYVAARFLLKPGRKYEDAVKEFSPYKAVKEVNPEARSAGAELVRQAKQKSKQAFIYVNNRYYTARGIKPVMPPPTLCRADRLEAHASGYSRVNWVSTRGIIKDSPERPVCDQLDDTAWVSHWFSSREPEPSPSLPYPHGDRSE